MVRVLLAEDSAVQREMFAYILEQESDFELVGTAVDGAEAVRLTKTLRPDILIMDFHMPKLNGLQATGLIMDECPTPIVVVTASFVPEEVGLSFETIKAGALAVIAKPSAPGTARYDHEVSQLVNTVRLMAEVKVVGRRRKVSASPMSTVTNRALAQPPDSKYQVLAIAGSTGAPAVIADILLALATKLTVPALVVQHISIGFGPGFAQWIGQKTQLPTYMGAEGVMTTQGSIYIAPDNQQMGIDSYGRIRLKPGAANDTFCPSADDLFRSIARSYGRYAIGVLLTGMGRDGASGLLAMREAGALTAVQDEESSIVFGMPREAFLMGAASHVLPPAGLVELIASVLPAPASKF